MSTFEQFGCFKERTMISVSPVKSTLSLVFTLNNSLYLIVFPTTVVLESFAYEYQMLTSNDPSTPILSPDLYPLNLWLITQQPKTIIIFKVFFSFSYDCFGYNFFIRHFYHLSL